jgi:ferrous iron transport protein A
MIFNFAQQQGDKTKKRSRAERPRQLAETPFAESREVAPVPEGEGCGTECGGGADVRGEAGDIAGVPVAFGLVYAALSDVEVGGRGVLGEFDMPEHVAEQLMNLGFLPGLEVMVAQSGPGGDPRVYRVDGTEVALRGELAKLIAVIPAPGKVSERILSLRGKGAAPAKPSAVGLSTQEASAD